jgi:hypothetical protein
MLPTCAGREHRPKNRTIQRRTETEMLPTLTPTSPVPTETLPPDTVGAGSEIDGTLAEGVIVVTEAESEAEVACASPVPSSATRRESRMLLCVPGACARRRRRRRRSGGGAPSRCRSRPSRRQFANWGGQLRWG